MLTPEQREFLKQHLTLDGDGNVVGNDNTVQAAKMDAGTYVAGINGQRITLTIYDVRRVLYLAYDNAAFLRAFDLPSEAYAQTAQSIIDICTKWEWL